MSASAIPCLRAESRISVRQGYLDTPTDRQGQVDTRPGRARVGRPRRPRLVSGLNRLARQVELQTGLELADRLLGVAGEGRVSLGKLVQIFLVGDLGFERSPELGLAPLAKHLLNELALRQVRRRGGIAKAITDHARDPDRRHLSHIQTVAPVTRRAVSR